MKIGRYEVTALLDGTFALDGGAMFGIVPRPLWRRAIEPDERNRIPLAARLLLIEGGGRVILVDTGLGDKWSTKRRDIFAVRQHRGGVCAQLRERGIDPDQVTDVILTHLHFDHAAGTTRRLEDGDLELVFPRARHHVQRRHWEWAHAPSPKDAGSFRAEDFAPLAGSGLLRLVDGDVELLPGIHVIALDGHTTAMQAVRVAGKEACLLYVADLVPTTAHLRWPWIMAYDNQPLVTLAEKQRHLLRAAAEGWLLALEHDPRSAAVRLREVEGGVDVAAEEEL